MEPSSVKANGLPWVQRWRGRDGWRWMADSAMSGWGCLASDWLLFNPGIHVCALRGHKLVVRITRFGRFGRSDLCWTLVSIEYKFGLVWCV